MIDVHHNFTHLHTMMASSFLAITAVFALYGAVPITAFVVVVNRPAAAVHRLASSNSDDLFVSEAWQPIQDDLDRVPIFTCANKQGNPLAYTIEMKGEKFTVPFFYCDVEDAKIELEKAAEGTGLDGIDLIPFPLGKAFKMWAQDEAVIIPSKQAIMQAGAPPDSNPIGQQVPLFACMDIMQSDEDGTGAVLPLFLDLEGANSAVASAVEIDGGDPNEFEVVSLSLQKAVQLLATVPETPAFQFMAPEKSLRYIQDYLS